MTIEEGGLRAIVAHSRSDKAFHDELATRLGAFTGGAVATVTGWEIEDAKAPEGDLLLLLVSNHLLASEACYGPALAKWIERHRAGEARVMPILVRPAVWSGAPFAGLPVLADHAPVDAAEDYDDAWDQVMEELRATLARPPAGFDGVPSGEPSPAYPDDAARRAGERLQALFGLRGSDPAIEVAIDSLAASMRKGPQLHPGEFLHDGRFRLLESLGHGPTATLWKAADRQHGRLVAIKVVHAPWTTDPDRVARYLEAVRKLGQLDHPHIAKIHEAARDKHGFLYVVTDYFPNGTVHEAVVARRLRGTPVLQVILDVARALEHAHRKGVVHGRVHPGNVLLGDDGSAVLVDFDVLREPAHKASLFDAPETLEPGHEPSPQEDVYSLGMTALFALYGKELPFWVLRGAQKLIDGLAMVDSVKDVLRTATEWDLETRYANVANLTFALLKDPAVVRALADSARGLARYAVAVEHYEALLQAATSGALASDVAETVELHTILGHTYLRMDRHDQAFDNLVAALSGAHELEPLFSLLRAVAEATGDYKRVAKAIEAEAQQRSAAARATLRVELATLLQEKMDDKARAIAAWQLVLDDHRDPRHAMFAHRALADLAKESEDWDGFVAHARELLPYLPPEQRPRVQHDIGEVYLVQKKDEQNGLMWIDRAAAGGYSSLHIAKILEDIRARKGQWPEVISLMRAQAAEQSNQQAVRTLLRGAHIARAVHLDDEARAIYRELLDRNANHHIAVRGLARMQYRAGRDDEAMELFATLCAAFDGKEVEEPEASERAADNVAYAQLLLTAGDTDGAMGRLEEALRLEPHHAPALGLIGPLYLARGEIPKARAVYERLLWMVRSEDPLLEQVTACLGLGDVEWIEGKLSEASQWYNKAVESDEESVAAWWGVAKVALASRGGHPGADRAPWLRATPNQFTAHEALARLLMGLLDEKAAKAWLQLDPMGRALVAGGATGARLACGVVDVLDRRGMIDADLFDRLAAACPAWARPIAAVRHRWLDVVDHDDSFPVQRSYQWARRVIAEDFDAVQPRGMLRAEVNDERVEGLGTDDAWQTLLAGAASEAPDAAAASPEETGAEGPGHKLAIVALVSGGFLRFALGKERDAAVIGSDEEADHRVADAADEHARLFRAGPNVYAEALGGRLVVNGEDLDACRLVGGEELSIAGERLSVRLFERTEDLPPLEEVMEAPAPAAARTPTGAPDAPNAEEPGEPADEPVAPDTTGEVGRDAPVSDLPEDDHSEEVPEDAAVVEAPPSVGHTLMPAEELEDEPASDAAAAEEPEAAAPPAEADEPAPEAAAAEEVPDEGAVEPAPEDDLRADPPGRLVAELDDLPREPTGATEEATPEMVAQALAEAAELDDTLPSLVPPPRGPTPLPPPPRSVIPGMSGPSQTVATYAPPPAPTATGSLKGISGPGKDIAIQIADQAITIGRGRGADVRLPNDNKVSGKHCRLERRPDGFFLVDTNSSNGTVVNGNRIKEIRLNGGETILIGRSILMFKVETPEPVGDL